MKNIKLPSGWQEVKLGDICNINSETLKENTSSDYKFKYIDLSSVKEGIINFPNNYITFKDAPSRARRKIKIDDIIMATVRPNLKGFAYINFDTKDYICSTGFAVLTSNSNICMKYIYHNLYSNYMEKQIHNMLVGSNYPALNTSDIFNLKILLPPIDEQKRIADILSLCDDIIENLTKLIEKKELYKKGVMQRVLTGKVRFNGFTDEWKTVRLGDILSYEQPNNYIVSSEEYDDKYKCPVLTAGKSFILGYTNEDFGIYNKYPVIIFDDFTTETKYVNFSFKVKSSAIKILSSSKHNLKLVYELMKLIKFNAETHKRYWISEYQHLEIKIPKSMEEQKRIAELLSTIDDEIDNLKKQLELRKLQKKGLMQRLLTGEVRV